MPENQAREQAMKRICNNYSKNIEAISIRQGKDGSRLLLGVNTGLINEYVLRKVEKN